MFGVGLAAISLTGSLSLLAEDWTTTDGKVYQKVTVVKSEPDAVTILYRDGGALVPLAKLPPDLQKRFHYDPVQAKAAADSRSQADAKNAVALQAERDEAEKHAALEQADQKAQLAAAQASLASSTTNQASPLHPEAFGLNSGQNEPTHYKTQDVLAPGPLHDHDGNPH